MLPVIRSYFDMKIESVVPRSFIAIKCLIELKIKYPKFRGKISDRVSSIKIYYSEIVLTFIYTAIIKPLTVTCIQSAHY